MRIRDIRGRESRDNIAVPHAQPDYPLRRVWLSDEEQDGYYLTDTAEATAAWLGGLGLRVTGEHFSQDAADFIEPAEVRNSLAVLATNFGA